MAARSGPQAMAVSAAFGGIILGIMEGVGAMLGRLSSDAYKPVAPQLDLPAAPPAAPSPSNNGDVPVAEKPAQKRGFFQ